MRNYFLIFLFVPLVFFGQITLDKAPEDFQLFPRDASNNASVVYSGKISDDVDKELKLKVFKDDLLVFEKTSKIHNKKFEISSIIKAGSVSI